MGHHGELLDNLRGLVRDVLKLRSEGAAYAKISRAHGYIDGYMRVLIETGIADHKALLAIVAEERRHADGPATGELEPVTTDSEARIVAA